MSVGNLEKIYASDKFVVNVASDRPFYQCEKLVGGAGTVWNENNVGADLCVLLFVKAHCGA